MGTNYYFRRDDNRIRYFMGKAYGLARTLETQPPFAVVQRGVLPMGIHVYDLAKFIEIGWIADGHSERQVAPTGRDNHGTSISALTVAHDVARWSDGMPISFVSEEGFEDWHDDPSCDENISTLQTISVSVLDYVAHSAHLGYGLPHFVMFTRI